MLNSWVSIFTILFVEAFFLSGVLTLIMIKLSVKWGVNDDPGERKVHKHPIPILGGVGIFLSFISIVVSHLVLLTLSGEFGFTWIHEHVAFFISPGTWKHLLPLLGGVIIIVALGLVDDLHPLGPLSKLIGQSCAALVLICSGIRLDLFIEPFLLVVPGVAGLDASTFHTLVIVLSSGATLFWILLITNALNFLDNMDGLCGGISIIAAFSFFMCLIPHGEYFICALLMVFAGSVGGFLIHNINPARIFMGDSGSMFCGFLLASIAVIGTFYNPSLPSRAAVVTPILALSVPLFDIFSVVIIRWRKGVPILKGDERHFSHRLVDLGFSHHQAVGMIYIVAAVTGLGGAVLLRMSNFATLVIFALVLAVFALIALLMKVPRRG